MFWLPTNPYAVKLERQKLTLRPHKDDWLDLAAIFSLIEHLPNPYQVRRTSQADLIAFFRQHGLRCGQSTAQHVLANAQAALLSPEPVVEATIPLLQRDFRLFQQVETLIAEAQHHLPALVDLTPARHLVPLPGLSAELAAKYLAVIGDPARFDHADQVWAFIGFDVLRDDSGDSRRVGHITKRGDPFGRAVFHQLGYQMALHYPPVGQVFFAALARGKSETEATLCAAHKAHRLCFRLLQDNRPYQDRTTPADRETHRRRWAEYRATRSAKPKASPSRRRRPRWRPRRR